MDKYSGNITVMNYIDQKPDLRLTGDIDKHINNINQLTIEKFNWLYYSAKYGDLGKIKTKQIAWDHWLRHGIKENRNPIDRKTISDSRDINCAVSLMMILLDAQKKTYDKIFILDLTNKNIQHADFNRVINEYKEIINEKQLCIFSYMKTNYAYFISKVAYDHLLLELSYMVNKFDDILTMYISSYTDSYQVFNHSNTCVNDSTIINMANVNKILFTGEQIYLEAMQFRGNYIKGEYNKFITEQKMTKEEINMLNYLIFKLPYDKIKTTYNSHLNLSPKNYFILCKGLPNQKYFENIKFKQLTYDIPDLNTVYFDHDFYLKLYPCYANTLKTKIDSYSHFTRHGNIEKLIGNEVIFELTKLYQEYILNQLITDFNMKKISDHPFLLYNTMGFNYYDNNKPIIYIITRTCNREALFKECYESIHKQLFVNVRHIVSYDNESTYQYVKKYDNIYKTIDLTSYKSKTHPNQYIDHIYEYLEDCDPGWVFVLDDDDKFMTNYALYHLEQYLTDPANLIIWMLYRPDKFIYPKNKNNPAVGDIGSCCYIYHTSKIKMGKWEGTSIGDFNFFKYVFDNTSNHIYIDYPLTGVNYSEKISGWTAM